MADLVVRTVQLGDVVTVVAVEVTCPRCGGLLRAVTHDDPRGFSTRERKLVLECVRHTCRWTGSFIGELVDLGTVRKNWRQVS